MNAGPYHLSFVAVFLKELRLSSLSVLSSRQIDENFRRTASQSRFIVWQFRQSVDAIQLLLVDVAQVSTGNHVDWDFWKEACKALEFHHPTLAKERALKDRTDARCGEPKFAGCAKALFPYSRTWRGRFALETIR